MDSGVAMSVNPPRPQPARHARAAPTEKAMNQHPTAANAGQRILITGATGFIGVDLVEALLRRGARVTAQTRDAAACRKRLGPRVATIAAGDWPGDARFDAVVNLAGARIAPLPWTAARRATLRASRIGTTDDLVRRFAAAAPPPAVWVQASAVGYYGPHDAALALTERSARGDDFAARLCGDWEASAAPMAGLGTRVCALRLGLVLGRGGALPGLLLPIRLGLGGPLGGGRLAFPWIHVDDVVALMLDCIDNPARSGAYNAVAPQAHTQGSFGRCAAHLLSRPFWLPAPSFPLRLLGEVSQLFLDGQHVVPERLLGDGWEWRFPALRGALESILAESGVAPR